MKSAWPESGTIRILTRVIRRNAEDVVGGGFIDGCVGDASPEAVFEEVVEGLADVEGWFDDVGDVCTDVLYHFFLFDGDEAATSIMMDVVILFLMSVSSRCWGWLLGRDWPNSDP